METENKNKSSIATKKGVELENRLIDFASRILDLVDALPKKATSKHIGGQIMRSGTSPALNYGEARAGESKADFVHKLKICTKELRETHIALRIIQKQKWFPDTILEPILDECNQLIAIFVASLKKALLQKE